MLGIQKMTVFSYLGAYVIKVSGIFLRTYQFLQFWKIQEEAVAFSFNHNCQTAGVHRIKQYLGLAIQKLINIIMQHSNSKILPSVC